MSAESPALHRQPAINKTRRSDTNYWWVRSRNTNNSNNSHNVNNDGQLGNNNNNACNGNSGVAPGFSCSR